MDARIGDDEADGAPDAGSDGEACAVDSEQGACECAVGYVLDGRECRRNECLPVEANAQPICGEHASCEDPSAALDGPVCACMTGYASCDGALDPAPGCETDITSDSMHCGECGSACANTCQLGECSQTASRLVLGFSQSCALLDPPDANGARALRCWGDNATNQLRAGAEPYRTSALSVPDVARVRELALGREHTCALDDDSDTVRCWGSNSYYQLGSSGTVASSDWVDTSHPGVEALAAGWLHSCALTSGSIACWGDNSLVQLGRTPSSQTDRRALPTAVQRAADDELVDDAVVIDTGAVRSCSLVEGGQAVCWGLVSPGLASPVQATAGGPIAPANQLEVGGEGYYFHACVRLEAGTVACWRDNSAGQLGTSLPASARNTAEDVPGLTNIIDLAAGARHTCALEASGHVQCWGYNARGELEVDSTEDATSTPMIVVGLDDVVDIEAGGYHNCARRRSGHVVCWGLNDKGQLGDGSVLTGRGIRAVVGLDGE